MSIFSIFNRNKPSMNVEILFHKDAAMYGTHGYLFADHRDSGLVKQRIRFAFKGMRHAPALTPIVLTYLFEKAKEAGFTPYDLVDYGTIINHPVETIEQVQTGLAQSMFVARPAPIPVTRQSQNTKEKNNEPV